MLKAVWAWSLYAQSADPKLAQHRFMQRATHLSTESALQCRVIGVAQSMALEVVWPLAPCASFVIGRRHECDDGAITSLA